MSQKIFDKTLVAILKSEVALKFNKPAYAGICVLELSNLLMYEFHYDYIKSKYDNKSKLLFTDTDSLIYEIKTEDDYEDFSSNKVMFNLNNYSTKSKYYDDSNKLVIGKMKDKAGSIAVQEFFGLKTKMNLFLVNDNSKHKKAKDVNRNIVATISHFECQHVLFDNKFLIHSMKSYRIGTYRIIKISLLCFDDKIYIQNNRHDGLALG